MSQEILIENYLESTYLKTISESDLNDQEHKQLIEQKVRDAIEFNFVLIMIRPRYISFAKQIIKDANAKTLVGTVIDFPFGKASTLQKIQEAQKSIDNGVDEIDYVSDYKAFKRGSFQKFEEDIIDGTMLGSKNRKIVKWIIETGALSKEEIKKISIRINLIAKRFFPLESNNIYIKTSTGYYDDSGATEKDIKIIKSVSKNLKIKASGGIKTRKEANLLIKAGADRIGTSKALEIFHDR